MAYVVIVPVLFAIEAGNDVHAPEFSSPDAVQGRRHGRRRIYREHEKKNNYEAAHFSPVDNAVPDWSVPIVREIQDRHSDR